MTNILKAVPTGRFAISAGTAIILGVQLKEGELDIGKGVMYQLDKWNLSAAGTYAFTYGGQQYQGTWFTTVVSTDGQTWVLSETFTGTIDFTKSFPAIARPSGLGEEAKITFIPPEPPDDVQSFQNDAPGQKAMIKFTGPLPVFGLATAYYYNAAYLG
ncbi:Hypothetical protein A7982_08453 [Minicystis rosea]|nr:Hypothetical protein A7982_08453 [Minicystis rosea]